MTPKTATQSKLVDAMHHAVDELGWERVDNDTIRYAIRGRPTPETIPNRWWAGETYSSLVFITLTPRGPLLRIGRSPWVGASDGMITYKRAFAVIDDPEPLIR